MVTAQQAALEAQQNEIARLKDRLASRGTAAGPPAESGADTILSNGSTPTSRRTLFKGGAIAAGAAVVGATVGPRAAAATDGLALEVGANNESLNGNTRLNGTGSGQYVNKNIFTVSDQNSTSQFEAAIGAYGEGDRVRNGLYAYTGDRDNSDATTGYAVVATNAGGRANLLLNPGASNPKSDTYAHRRGAVRSDGGGNLWFCTTSGTPGTWRKLAGPASSGALHAIDPARVYDSRFADGPLGSGFNRQVSTANAIDALTGDLRLANVVPSGATAVFFNLTITQTTGSGFVFVAPGDATVINGSTINWFASATTAANASLSTLDDSRTLKAFVAGGGTTHFIIDITGYTE
jgi:hypothetical protein